MKQKCPLQPYCVYSPQYEYMQPLLDGGSGPVEDACDIAYVEACSKREAIVLGVRQLRASKQRHSYFNCAWDSSQNPYVGFKAELAVCKHGQAEVLVREDGSVEALECADCEEEFEREWQQEVTAQEEQEHEIRGER